MDEANIVTRGCEQVLGDLVITACPFNGHNQITQVVFLAGGVELRDRGVQFRSIVLDRGRPNENPTIEIAQHPFEARFRAIDADDAEVFRPDALDARLNHTVGLVSRRNEPPTLSSFACHGNHLQDLGMAISQSSQRRLA